MKQLVVILAYSVLELWAVYALMQMPGMLGSSGTDPEGLGKAICLSTIKRIAVAHRCHTYSAEGVVFVLGDCVQWQVITALCFAFCHPLLIVRTAAFPPSLLLQPL